MLMRAGVRATAVLLALSLASAALAQEQRRIRYFNQEWSFDDVDVATLSRRLGQVGLQLPVTLAGKISGALNVGVPWGALRDARTWRFGGSLTSPELSINGFVLRGVVLRVQYRDGSLRLTELRVGVPASAQQAAPEGVVTGSAEMELVPRGQLRAAVDAQSLPIVAFLRRLQALQPVEGELTGRLTAQVDVNRLQDVRAWRISGPVTLNGLTVRDLPPAEATATLSLDSGIATASKFRLTLGQATVDADARLNLLGNQAWLADATLRSPQLADLVGLVARALGNESITQSVQHVATGAVELTAQVAGTLAPAAARASGRLELADIEVRPPAELVHRLPLKPLRLDRVAFNYLLTGDAFRATDLTASLAGGRATGAVTVPLGGGNVEASLQWLGLRIADLLNEPFGGSGITNGALQLLVPNGDWGNVAQWRLTSNAEATGVAYGALQVERIQTGSVSVSDGRLRVPRFSATLDGEPLALSLDMLLAAPWSLEATFDLPRLSASWLAGVPQLSALAGRISGVLSASGRASGVWSPQFVLQGSAQVRGSDLRFDAYAIDRMQADVSLTPEQLNVSALRFELYGGAAEGTATVALGEKLGANASIAWRGVDATAIGRGLSASPISPAGETSGSLTVNIPAGAVNEPLQWSGVGTIQLAQVNSYGLPFAGLRASEVILGEGRVRAPKLTAQLYGQPVEASASLGITAPMPLDASVRLSQVQVSHLGTLLQVEFLRDRGVGRVDFAADVKATLTPFELSATGVVAGGTVALLDHPIDQISFAYAYDAHSFAMSKLDATLYDGRVTGELVVPLVEEAAGSAAVAWTGLDLGKSLGNAVELPFNLQGRSDGRASLTIPAGSLAQFTRWDVDAQLKVPDLQANGVAVASLDASVKQQAQALSYGASGQLLGGTFSAQGRRGADAPQAGLALLGDLRLSLRGANVETAVSVGLDREQRPAPVEGTFDLNLITANEATGWSWRAGATVTQVRAEGVELTPGIQLRASGTERSVQLEQLSGELAGGQLSASGQWQVAQRRSPVFRVGLRGAQLGRVSHLLTDQDELPLEGPIDVELRVRPGDTWRVAGTIGSGQGDFYDVRFSNLRVPVDVEWHPPSGRMRVQVSSMNLSLAGGRMAGRLVAQRTTGWMLDAAFKFYRVDVVTLIRQLGSESQYGKGRLTGTLTLTGRNMQSIDELRGVLNADLEDAQARGLPVIGNLSSYVPGAGASGATQFGEGRLEARLMRGVVYLDRLTLASRQLDVYLSGLINLTGRLRLEAVVYTGHGQNPLIASALLTRITAIAAPPAALLASASDFLSNRVIYLDIGGTLSRPVIRVRPLDILREEVIRYFLRRAAGVALGTGAPVPAATAPPRQ